MTGIIGSVAVTVVEKLMDSRFLQADELGVRLEMVGGLPLWEPHPVYTLLVLHVRRDQTKRSVSPVEIALECGCGCIV